MMGFTFFVTYSKVLSCRELKLASVECELLT